MKTTTLPCGQATSQLGFGGTVLKGGPGRQENLRLLNIAYDAGFRHFDVAPSYGLGVAEGVLSEFIHEVRQSVTVTTKVGLPRPRNANTLAQLRAMVRPFLSFAPALRRYVGRSVQHLSGSASTRFDLAHLQSSFEESLRELRTDYVDVLLLHEITPSEVSDDLRRYLQDIVAKGMVRTCGIGSYRHEAEATVRACPELASIMQTSWTVGDDQLDLSPHDPFIVTHSAVRPLSALRALLSANHNVRQAISEKVGVDVGDPERLASLMLAAALSNNERGIVLVSSTRPDRLVRHATLSGDQAMIAAGRLFNAMVTEELVSLRK